MKVLSKSLIILMATSLPQFSYAFPEIPFCPGGGPPGWLNHFNYKRDQNIWRHYSQYSSPAYNQPAYHQPDFGYGTHPQYRSDYNKPYNYSAPPYYYQQRTDAGRRN